MSQVIIKNKKMTFDQYQNKLSSSSKLNNHNKLLNNNNRGINSNNKKNNQTSNNSNKNSTNNQYSQKKFTHNNKLNNNQSNNNNQVNNNNQISYSQQSSSSNRRLIYNDNNHKQKNQLSHKTIQPPISHTQLNHNHFNQQQYNQNDQQHQHQQSNNNNEYNKQQRQLSKIDLIFQKQPEDVQRKLRTLLLNYNAVMQYNKQDDKFEVDLLLPFNNIQQKQIFVNKFMKTRQYIKNQINNHNLNNNNYNGNQQQQQNNNNQQYNKQRQQQSKQQQYNNEQTNMQIDNNNNQQQRQQYKNTTKFNNNNNNNINNNNNNNNNINKPLNQNNNNMQQQFKQQKLKQQKFKQSKQNNKINFYTLNQSLDLSIQKALTKIKLSNHNSHHNQSIQYHNQLSNQSNNNNNNQQQHNHHQTLLLPTHQSHHINYYQPSLINKSQPIQDQSHKSSSRYQQSHSSSIESELSQPFKSIIPNSIQRNILNTPSGKKSYQQSSWIKPLQPNQSQSKFANSSLDYSQQQFSKIMIKPNNSLYQSPIVPLKYNDFYQRSNESSNEILIQDELNQIDQYDIMDFETPQKGYSYNNSIDQDSYNSTFDKIQQQAQQSQQQHFPSSKQYKQFLKNKIHHSNSIINNNNNSSSLINNNNNTNNNNNKQRLLYGYNANKVVNSSSLRKKYAQFLNKNHKKIQSLYLRIGKQMKKRKQLQQKQYPFSQKRHNHPKQQIISNNNNEIIISDNDDSIIMNDKQINQGILQDYKKRIVMQNDSMSSQDKVRYFRYLAKHAKGLYIQYIRGNSSMKRNC